MAWSTLCFLPEKKPEYPKVSERNTHKRKRSEFERRRWERDDQFRDNADLERDEMGTCRVRTARCCPRLRIQQRRCDASGKPKAAPKLRRREDDGLFTYFSRQELALLLGARTGAGRIAKQQHDANSITLCLSGRLEDLRLPRASGRTREHET